MVAAAHPANRSLWKAFADAIRPAEVLSPSELASKHRILHQVYCTERPGKWDSSAFPYQAPLMDMVQEAIDSGKRGVVYMKSGQGGGTDLAINALCWLKLYRPGPILFMTSTETVASEFGRERWENVIKDMPPLAARYRPSARGDILTKRFVDGKIQLTGGQSIFNLQSTPYRHVGIDELDSLVDNLAGEGDPLKLAEVRTDSFVGPTLFVTYAHPTTKDRGAARIFYENSDQRRGFVRHASCGNEFWLQWDHVKCIGNKADADSYVYACPNCGEVIPDAERVAMVRRVEYRSVLDPEQAKLKPWIGAHFSQLYYPAKSLRSLAQRWIECGDDDNAKRVFFNKVLGEPYEPKIKSVDSASMRALICVKRRPNDPEFYTRGQVPPGVRFLTAGQDSRSTELHFSIWGWGLRRKVDNLTTLCAWLIDWGRIERPYSLTFDSSEFHAFDNLIYRRSFPSAASNRNFHVSQCGHDIGWQPTQIPIVHYVRSWPNRAFPIKGASETPSSATRADYMRLGNPIPVKIDDETVRDAATQPFLANTYQLKAEWYGMLDRRIEVLDFDGTVRKAPVIMLPEDVDETFISQSCSEFLAPGERKGELVWKHKGPNHYADCNTYAHGLALNLNPALHDQTEDESNATEDMPEPAREPPRDDPSYN